MQLQEAFKGEGLTSRGRVLVTGAKCCISFPSFLSFGDESWQQILAIMFERCS
jgi:hypothetical protein